jgi:hypothetical protein
MGDDRSEGALRTIRGPSKSGAEFNELPAAPEPAGAQPASHRVEEQDEKCQPNNMHGFMLAQGPPGHQ